MKAQQLFRSLALLAATSLVALQPLSAQRRGDSSTTSSRRTTSSTTVDNSSRRENSSVKPNSDRNKPSGQPDRGQGNVERPSSPNRDKDVVHNSRPSNKPAPNKPQYTSPSNSKYGNRGDRYKADYIRRNGQHYVHQAPPKPRYEPLRYDNRYHNRRGYVWVSGYWQWDNWSRSYYWVDGYWARERAGYAYYPGYWEPVRGGYVWIEGGWF